MPTLHLRHPLLLVPAGLGLAAALAVAWRGTRQRPAAGKPAPAPLPSAASAPAPPRSGGRLWVGLESLGGQATVTLIPTASGQLLSGKGRRLARVSARVPLTAQVDPATGRMQLRGKGLAVEDAAPVLDAGLVRVAGRRYPGRLRFQAVGDQVTLVNDLDIEQYLQGVLPGELPRGFAPAAQRAQAVAARSYALAQRGKHGSFDLCDEQCCQMYLGQVRNAVRGLAAVRDTRRLCLWNGEQPACAFFSADCGGMMARAADVPLRDMPPGDHPFLQVKSDGPATRPYCEKSPYHHWTRMLDREVLEQKLNRREPTAIGRLRELTVLSRDGSGRVASIRLRGEVPDPTVESPVRSNQPTPADAPVPGANTPLFTPPLPPGPVEKVISGWELRRSMGALTLKSTLFQVAQSGPDSWQFQGGGFGHGLGMCQIGADVMGRRGFTWRQILAHYYPGARIAAVSP